MYQCIQQLILYTSLIWHLVLPFTCRLSTFPHVLIIMNYKLSAEKQRCRGSQKGRGMLLRDRQLYTPSGHADFTVYTKKLSSGVGSKLYLQHSMVNPSQMKSSTENKDVAGPVLLMDNLTHWVPPQVTKLRFFCSVCS